jgi:hypothetical protein
MRKEPTATSPPINLVGRAVRCTRKLDIRYEVSELITGQRRHVAMAYVKGLLNVAHDTRGQGE